MYASYLVLDGIEVDGNQAACSGLPCSENYNIGLGGPAFHHSWITNTYSHGAGGGGIGAGAAGDCMWFIHNVTTDNSATSTYAESGISIWEPSNVAGLTSCGSSSFHMQVLWNVSAHNLEGSTIPAADHTDGDGIIMDTFTANGYSYTSLVANNVAFDNGGFCIGQDNSDNVTFANNTCYNDYRDTMNPGTYRGEIFNNGGSNVSYLNNLVQSVPGPGILANNVTALSYASATSFTWTHNVFFGPSPVDDTSGHLVPVSSATNMLSSDPLWVSAASGNFALEASSPALDYGITESYLLSTDKDVGACAGGLSTCPNLAF